MAFSTPKAFGPSVDVHITKMMKLCSQYPWHRVVNYEIAFFHRYYTVDTPDTAWSQYDQGFLSEYLVLPSAGNLIPTHNAPNSQHICKKFKEGKYCNQYSCKFAHACTFDRTRCSGAHTAADCPLNPHRRPLNTKDRPHSGGNGYNQPYNSNPNFTRVKDQTSRDADRDRYRQRKD